MNPAAKRFSEQELSLIAKLAQEFDTLAICDEVYEHIVFDGKPHVPLMSLPGMRDRCVRIGSAGKSFSLTGWKVGYITACPALLGAIAKAHQFVTFTTPPNLQAAIAHGLTLDDAYFNGLTTEMEDKRNRFDEGLKSIGFKTAQCQATYFLSADIRSVGFDAGDVAFSEWITRDGGVAAVPMSAFYQNADEKNFVRFCFCKRDEVLDAAIEKLGNS